MGVSIMIFKGVLIMIYGIMSAAKLLLTHLNGCVNLDF